MAHHNNSYWITKDKMDKKLINENNLNDAINHFQHLAEYRHPKQSLKNLYEYTFITNRAVNEDDDENDGSTPNIQDDNITPLQDGNIPQNGEKQETSANVGNNMPQDTGVNNDNTAAAAPSPQIDTMPSNNEEDKVEEPSMVDNIETREMEDGDEVIDVDDLTQSQEATEYKIDGVDDRLSKLYAVVKKFSDQLDKNAENIQSLKAEFERRNPTEEEKLNIRSQSSYPYTETPKEYWSQQVKNNPHYQVIYDNDVAPNDEQEEFKITRNDISGLDMRSISDTLDMNQNLKKYIGF